MGLCSICPPRWGRDVFGWAVAESETVRRLGRVRADGIAPDPPLVGEQGACTKGQCVRRRDAQRGRDDDDHGIYLLGSVGSGRRAAWIGLREQRWRAAAAVR